MISLRLSKIWIYISIMGESLEGAGAPSFHPLLPLAKGKEIQGMGLPNYYEGKF